MNYIELKAGDIRKLNDEVRPKEGFDTDFKDGRIIPAHPDWRGVNLIGHRILASDLIHLEFRRPTP